MKKLAFATLALLSLVTRAHAASETKNLVCDVGHSGHGAVSVQLSSEGWDPASGYMRVVDASLYFNYSGVQDMSCDGIVRRNEFDVDCVGLYAGIRQPTLLKLRSEGHHIVALWRTNKYYGNKAMKSVCRFE